MVAVDAANFYSQVHLSDHPAPPEDISRCDNRALHEPWKANFVTKVPGEEVLPRAALPTLMWCGHTRGWRAAGGWGFGPAGRVGDLRGASCG